MWKLAGMVALGHLTRTNTLGERSRSLTDESAELLYVAENQSSPLLVAERDQWVDLHRAARRQIAGEERDQSQHSSHRREH